MSLVLNITAEMRTLQKQKNRMIYQEEVRLVRYRSVYLALINSLSSMQENKIFCLLKSVAFKDL